MSSSAKKKEYYEHIIEILSNVDVLESKIVYRNTYILLFGGLVRDVTEESVMRSRSEYSPHFRNWIMCENHKYTSDAELDFLLPEEFKDYYQEGKYKDLLEFELDLISICTLVVVCLESPGALVEFGMLSTLTEIYEKLIVIISERYASEQSFIMYGPVENITRKFSDAIAVYPEPLTTEPYNEEDIKNLVLDIKNKALSLKVNNRKFDIKQVGHVCFLVYELIKDFYPLISQDIENLLEKLLINISKNKLSNLIYLLRKLDLIESKNYSNLTYYYPKNEATTLFQYSLKDKSIKLDLAREIVILRESGLDTKRKAVLTKILGVR